MEASPAFLRGSCACERNQYSIALPSSPAALQEAEVFLDPRRANRLAHEPLFLRIPLAWYNSATYALYPDESHAAIRRSFHTGLSRPRRKQFCGFCGTPLVVWDEGDGVDWVDVMMGSLERESVDLLEEVGLLGSGSEAEDEEDGGVDSALQGAVKREVGGRAREAPFYEEVTDMGRRGRIKRRRGGHTSDDGRTTVEWEVVELEGGEDGDLVMEENIGEESAVDAAKGSKRLKTSG